MRLSDRVLHATDCNDRKKKKKVKTDAVTYSTASKEYVALFDIRCCAVSIDFHENYELLQFFFAMKRILSLLCSDIKCLVFKESHWSFDATHSFVEMLWNNPLLNGPLNSLLKIFIDKNVSLPQLVLGSSLALWKWLVLFFNCTLQCFFIGKVARFIQSLNLNWSLQILKNSLWSKQSW